MRSPSLFLLFFLTGFFAHSQANLDSLSAIWNDASQADTSRLKAMDKFALAYKNQPDSALYWREKHFAMAESLGNKRWMGNAQFAIGRVFFKQKKFTKAIEYATKSLEHFEEIGDKRGIVKNLKLIGFSYETQTDFPKALEYYNKSLKIREELGDKLATAQNINQIGVVYYKQGDFDKVIEYFTKSLKVGQEIGDKHWIGRTSANIGVVYEAQDKYALALEYFNRSLMTSEQLSDTIGTSNLLTNIGIVYGKQKDSENAKKYFTRSLKLKEEIGDKQGLSNTLTNLGNIYNSQDEKTLALECLNRSLEIKKELGDIQGVATNLGNIGGVYLAQHDYPQAMEYYTKGLKISKESGFKHGISASLNNIGIIHKSQYNYTKAISYSTRSLDLANAIEVPSLISEAALNLYKSYESTGQYRRALEMYQLHISMRDSLEREENRKAIIQQQYRYEYEQKALSDSLIFVQTSADTQLAYEAQLTQRNYLLFGGLGLALLGFVYFRFRQQSKAREQERALELERVEKLEQIDKLKDQFLANTSHELRTPLNGIIGITEGLFDEAEDAETRYNLGMVVASGKRLASLVNDLLDFSKIKNADIELNQRPLDLHSVVDVVLQVSYPLTQGKDLQLENNIPKDLSAAFADEDRLTQVLFNLIGNSIKFTEKGFLKVTAFEKEGIIEVAVSDSGTGIPADKQDVIFETFQQADGSINRTFAGTGLGLSISKTLIERHGGKMWVESEVGRGSTFFFTLPMSTEKAQASAEEATVNRLMPLVLPDIGTETASNQQEVNVMTSPTGQAIRILIVDDEPINHQVLKNHLKGDRFQLVSAMNGQDALHILEQEEIFDLVLLDIMMPGMSGYSVCKFIREKHLPSELPVIMVTAKNQVSDLVQGLNIGANDFLTKPFSKNEFLARLNTHLNLHRINQSTSRFVPSAFLRALGKNTITEVRLGDNISKEVTVFFSDIRSYTRLSESMNPDDNFRFINAYAKRMGPAIQAHRGFVNQYLGDGIMALFQESPADAIEASIEMQAAIRKYNTKRVAQNRLPLRVGMGMHTGHLVMGIIGDLKRSDAAIIADTVNTAARIEGLSKHYGTNIVLSDKCYQHLSPERKAHCRYLGLVQVQGKEKPIGIYECMDGDDASILDMKLANLPTFQSGIEAYLNGDIAAAKSAFTRVLDKHPEDGPARYFLNRVEKLGQQGVAENWTGVLTMDEK
ncbi:MAG: tetratricopeptide repeat protein [Bacteroidia bacterium]